MEQLIDINYLGVNIQAGHTAGSKHHATYTHAIQNKIQEKVFAQIVPKRDI